MSAVLDMIIKANKITDYLMTKSVQWHSHDGDRYKYRCPLPSHKADKTPSFFIYEKPDREDFYCYGCKSAGSIIQFVAAFEQISIKEAIRKLSAGLNINVDDILDSVLREIIVSSEKVSKEDKKEEVLANNLFISVHMHDFLKKVSFDIDEVVIAEKVFALTDSLVYIENLSELEALSRNLPERTKQRYVEYMNKKREEEIQTAREFKIYE